MNYDLIYSFERNLVLVESEKIDSNKQINQMNKNKLRYRGKKCDELRKVSISKANNLIAASHEIYKRKDQICLQLEINRNLPDWPRDRGEQFGSRLFSAYLTVSEVIMDFLALLTHREGLSRRPAGTFSSIPACTHTEIDPKNW